MPKKIHMSQSVRGPLMNWTPRQWQEATDWMKRDDGSRYESGDALKAAFLDLLVAGNEVIPVGECDDFDPKKGCRGHDIPDSEMPNPVTTH